MLVAVILTKLIDLKKKKKIYPSTPLYTYLALSIDHMCSGDLFMPSVSSASSLAARYYAVTL